MSTGASLTTIAICQLLTTLAGLASVAALIYGIVVFKRMINSKLDEVMGKLQPIVDQAKSIADQAQETAEMLSEKIDAIASKAEDTADHVGEKVKTVSDKVEEAISPQVIAVAGAVGAAVRCLEIVRDVVKLRRDHQ